MDRAEAIGVIKELLVYRDNDSKYPCVSSPRHYEALDLAIEALKEPTLVHCKDCKFKRLYDGETKYYYCTLEDRPNRNWSVDDWNFCSWAERRE